MSAIESSQLGLVVLQDLGGSRSRSFGPEMTILNPAEIAQHMSFCYTKNLIKQISGRVFVSRLRLAR